ncbi:unnamed protein product [Aureobasidium pullulans]|nr:hypothetical protein D6D29_04187 [Aureobasidium pullulans]CAD0020347.1 unnamed protein product [Aureobasidium pullulans]CAD0059399.1 unnamed protein product [Aureobasidium pullulans]
MEQPKLQIVEAIIALDQTNVADVLRNAFKLIADCYEAEMMDESLAGARHLLEDYSVPPYLCLKLCIVISASSNNWPYAEEYRLRAERLYTSVCGTPYLSSRPDVDLEGIRKELDILSAYQLDNPPAFRPTLPQSLVLPSDDSMLSDDDTEEEEEQLDEVRDECAGADSLYDYGDMPGYVNALEDILHNCKHMSPLVKLRTCLLVASVTDSPSRAISRREDAEQLWREQKNFFGADMPADVQSFLQAARVQLDELAQDVLETGSTSADDPVENAALSNATAELSRIRLEDQQGDNHANH